MSVIKELISQKSGMLAIFSLLTLTVLSVVMPIIYGKYYKEWRNINYWVTYPKTVPPEWVNLFTSHKLPPHMILKPYKVYKKKMYGGVLTNVTLIYKVTYHYDYPPSDIIINVTSNLSSAVMIVKVKRADGKTITLVNDIYSNVPHPLSLNNFKDVRSALYSWLINQGYSPPSPSALSSSAVVFCKLVNGCWLKGTTLKGEYVFTVTFLAYKKDIKASGTLILAGRVYGLLGTDAYGRDLFIYLMLGLPYGMLVGVLASVFSAVIGTLYGLISGYAGGIVDRVMQRVLEIWYSLPALPLLILAAVVYKPDIWLMIVFITIFSWMGVAKIVRSMVLQLKEEGYVLSAKATGAKGTWIMRKHILPQLLPYVFAQVALGVPAAILTEVGLDFLGLGDPNTPTWGWLLHDAQIYGAAVNGYWWWVIPPGLMIAWVGLTFAAIGYAMDTLLNPRLREE